MDAVSVASWHDTHERYVKELDMYQLDLFYGADSAHKYFTIDDAIDRRQMLPDNRRALVFEVVEKQIPMKLLPPEMGIDGRVITPCGYCGEELPKKAFYTYCPYCGQKIKR